MTKQKPPSIMQRLHNLEQRVERLEQIEQTWQSTCRKALRELERSRKDISN